MRPEFERRTEAGLVVIGEYLLGCGSMMWERTSGSGGHSAVELVAVSEREALVCWRVGGFGIVDLSMSSLLSSSWLLSIFADRRTEHTAPSLNSPVVARASLSPFDNSSTQEARLHSPFDVTAVAAIHRTYPTFQVAFRLLLSLSSTLCLRKQTNMATHATKEIHL